MTFRTDSKHPTLSACAIAMVASVMAAAPMWANANDSAKRDSQSMPAGHMKQAKMDCMEHMGNGMSMSKTGDADHDFAANMRMHHQVAVDMSQTVLKNGKDPKMLAMAGEIIAAQKKEMTQLDEWLVAHKKAMPEKISKPK